MASNLDREVDALIVSCITGIGRIFKKIFYGLKKLKKPKNFIVLGVCMLGSLLIFRQKEILFGLLERMEMPGLLQTVVYVLLLSAPLVYLAMLGGVTDKKQEEYNQKFESIGFKEKSGKYPIYIDSHEDDAKRTIYTFKTDISLGEWKRREEQLETALDCMILKIDNKGSKKIVQLLAVSSEYKIPEKLLWKDEYLSAKNGEIVAGQGVINQVTFNLNRTPHVLAAGETGSGKSVVLRCCLWQLINQSARVYMFDFKGGVEFGIDYEQFGEVITDRKRAVEVLEMLVEENSARLTLFRQLRVKNLPEYNKKTGKNLCRIGVFCDEIAEMLDRKGISKEDKPMYDRIEGLISTLARLSRATGINLFLGVQRPDANVLTGQIKNNIPVRICGRFADKSASEIVLNSTAAVNLPDIKGRFLYLMGNELMEFQAYYFDDETMLHPVEAQQGEMLIFASEESTDDSDDQGEQVTSPKPLKPVIPRPSVKEVKEEDFNFDYDDDSEIEWSVNK